VREGVLDSEGAYTEEESVENNFCTYGEDSWRSRQHVARGEGRRRGTKAGRWRIRRDMLHTFDDNASSRRAPGIEGAGSAPARLSAFPRQGEVPAQVRRDGARAPPARRSLRAPRVEITLRTPVRPTVQPCTRSTHRAGSQPTRGTCPRWYAETQRAAQAAARAREAACTRSRARRARARLCAGTRDARQRVGALLRKAEGRLGLKAGGVTSVTRHD
jgi:hypothetical protein